MANDDYEFFKDAKENLFPMMKDAALSLTILNSDPDPKLCMELGAAIMFNKPIVVVCPDGYQVPPALEKIATHVIRGDINDTSLQTALVDALHEITGG